MNILVTGGAGFIGAHFVRTALENGLRVVVLDDLSAGAATAVPRGATFLRGDIANRSLVRSALRTHEIDAVVHFAGKIDVAESVREPRIYFEANVSKSLALLDAVVAEARANLFLFSSSAAVYAASDLPLGEDSALGPANPYGMTKLAVEHALAAYANAYQLRWAALRYFNAAGAHPDGTLRETHDPETHLIPLAIGAALGRGGPLTIFGDDYRTPDGTCIRDYVHVCDLADAHLSVLAALAAGVHVGATNLGTGVGFSVKQVIATCERVMGKSVPHSVGQRRIGDPATLVARADRARTKFGWSPKRLELEQIIEDALRPRRS